MAFRSNREIAIHVDDVERADAFYVGVLGCRLVSRSEHGLELDTGQLRLYVNSWGINPRTYIPSFDVPDLAAARQHLLAAGTRVVAADAEGGSEYFVDPFGFIFDLVERELTPASSTHPLDTHVDDAP